MEEVFVNVKGWTIDKLFKKDIVSVSDLVAELEELMFENEDLKEKLREEKIKCYEMEEG